jgi:hypothetical protein
MLEAFDFLRRRPKSSDPEQFGVFLDERAAFVAQKTILDYCRVKAGKNERSLFADPDFKAALNHCRWEVFAAATVDVQAMAESWLRPFVANRQDRLIDALISLHSRVAAASDTPGRTPDSLAVALLRIRSDLSLRALAPPRPADKLPLTAEEPLLATLPVHFDQRKDETPAITGALRFHIVSAQQDMERAFDPAALAARLVPQD